MRKIFAFLVLLATLLAPSAASAQCANSTIAQFNGTTMVCSTTLTTPTILTPTITSGTHTSATALSVRNTAAAFDLLFASTDAAMSANRTITWDTSNGSRTIALAGNFSTAGGNALTLTTAGATNVTLPTSGTLSILGANTFVASQNLTLTTNASLLYTIINASTGTSALAAFSAVNSANTAGFGIGSTTYTGPANSILLNMAFIDATSGAAGITLNNEGDKPIIFTRLNTEIARFNASGSMVLTVGNSANSVAGTIRFAGATSGSLDFKVPAAAGSNSITWPAGTVDFSATGGTSQVVKQTSTGGAFTVARLACADLSDSAATCSSASGESLVIGTTPITSGTTTRILYDNAGILGEYTITGSGTVVAMQTAPTFVTSITNPLMIGGTGTTSTVTIRSTSGTGTTGADIIFQAGTGGATEIARMTNAGLVLVGSATAGNTTNLLQVNATSAASAGFSLGIWSNDASGGFVVNRKSRGAVGTNTIVQNNDQIGTHYFTAADGTNQIVAAQIDAYVDGTPGTNDMPGRLIFSTTADGAASATERLRISNAGLTTVTGTFAVTAMANSATTSAVCYNTGTGLFTYNSTVGTCTVSTLAAKTLDTRLAPREGLDIVMSMEPWRYHLKEGLPTYVPGEQVGMIAEYAALRDERLVARDPDGRIAGFRYEQYTAALTGAVQALKAANDNLEQRIQQLERKIVK